MTVRSPSSRWLCAAVALALAASAAAEPPLGDAWYPSKYGAEDTLGAINELSPAGIVAAAKLVETGKSYALAIETGRETPAFGANS